MFAAIYIPDFPLEAILRAEPELRQRAVAVLEGTPPLVKVIAVNQLAAAAGVEVGLTKLQVSSGVTAVEVRQRSQLQERAAHAALLDCAQSFSPRVEDTAADTVVLDITGLERLFGAPARLGQDLARRVSEMGLEANVAVAANPDAAVHMARGWPHLSTPQPARTGALQEQRRVIVIPPGKEAERLGELPVDVLFAPHNGGQEAQPAEDARALLEILDRWGVRNLRALAALPEVALSERLGQQGLRLQKLARGEVLRPLVPAEPPLHFEEAMELEHPVDLLEPLAFILGHLLEQLCARLRARALATNEVRIRMDLEPMGHGENIYTRTLRLPVPMLDAKVLLKLLQLELKAHPPGAPVVKVALAAEPVRPRPPQSGLFLPASPLPERLELTLARLRGVIGEQKVGAAELLDTHAPQGFRMQRFAPPEQGRRSSTPDSAAGAAPGTIAMAIRLLRPPLKATVEFRAGRPTHVATAHREVYGKVIACAGPWRTSGNWWKQSKWERDEWDIAVSGDAGTVLYRIFRNLSDREWFVEGEYD